jgi:hypothetical protein
MALRPLAHAFLAALAVQPVPLVVLYGGEWLLSGEPPHWHLGTTSIVVVVLVALSLVPLISFARFLASRRGWRIRAIPMIAAGAILAATVPAILAIPGGYPEQSAWSTWHGATVQICDGGVPTVYAWLGYLEQVLYVAFHGGLAAFVFHRVRLLSRRSGDAI